MFLFRVRIDDSIHRLNANLHDVLLFSSYYSKWDIHLCLSFESSAQTWTEKQTCSNRAISYTIRDTRSTDSHSITWQMSLPVPAHEEISLKAQTHLVTLSSLITFSLLLGKENLQIHSPFPVLQYSALWSRTQSLPRSITGAGDCFARYFLDTYIL